MRRIDLAFFGVAGVLLAIIVLVLVLPAAKISGAGSAGQLLPQATGSSASNIIAAENAHLGTRDWLISAEQEATTQIQAYTSATSVQPGQTLTFYVSTQEDGTHYSIGIYRLGWYGGQGGRLKFFLPYQVGHAQGYYDPQAHQLISCFSCHIDAKTGLVEANWQPSYALTVPTDWVTGVYLAKFTDVNGMQTYAVFDVRGNYHSPYVVVTSDTTDEAYNRWGGYSLYVQDGSAQAGSLEGNDLKRAVKVSFDRPYLGDSGSGHVLIFEADAIHWLEREGYDLSYMSSADLHEHPMQLLQHNVYLSIGHDEYWTKEMRDGVEYARDHGVSLGFLGANTAFWQMRFEPDSAGTADRTIVCYKVQTDHNDLALDPLYGKDNSRVTSQWRDPVINRPENALVGIMYSSLNPNSFSWRVSPQANSPLLDRTGLQPGHQYGCKLVGYEWDRIFNNGATPAGLQVIGTSTTIDANNQPDFSNTTYYVARSGALVFAAGSIYWTASLDKYRLFPDKLCPGQSLVAPGMQQLMLNVMFALRTHRL